MRGLLALAVSTSLVSGVSLRAFAEQAPASSQAAAPSPAARAPAGTAAGTNRMVTDDCARARKAGKTCELTLPPEDVGGTTLGPDDIALRLLPFGRAGSLIHVRYDFISEIVKSAEDL
jgi:hypothetical protein